MNLSRIKGKGPTMALYCFKIGKGIKAFTNSLKIKIKEGD
jgi:hypothetical protein